MRLGAWLNRNCELFPKTVQLLKQSEVPLAMRGVIVARQVPGTGVQPHSDGRNFFLTAHFGLSIPPDCAITVGGEERPWKEDDCIILAPWRFLRGPLEALRTRPSCTPRGTTRTRRFKAALKQL